VANGCPLSTKVTEAAVRNKHYDVYHWLIAAGCPSTVTPPADPVHDMMGMFAAMQT
jgi:hypothetical protein